MSLIARHFEAAGLPTLILGSALDIMTAGRPPRAQFLNFPLGFEAGQPNDPAIQHAVLDDALRGFAEFTGPTINWLPHEWDAGWDMIAARTRDSTREDLRSPRDTTPQYQHPEDRAAAEQAHS